MTKQVEIHPSAKLASNVTILGDLTVEEDVVIGSGVTICPQVRIGAGTRVLSGAVIGRPPIRTGKLVRPLDQRDISVRIGKGCLIGANAVIYNDIVTGDSVMVSDLASVREGCRLADDVVLGRRTTLLYNVNVGARSIIHDGTHLTGDMTVEEDVFMGPLVASYNDPRVHLRRFELLPLDLSPPVVRRFSLIGTHATIGAGIEVGEGAIVAPAAMVTRDVDAWTVVAGVPARHLRKVADEERVRILRNFGLDVGDSA